MPTVKVGGAVGVIADMTVETSHNSWLHRHPQAKRILLNIK